MDLHFTGALPSKAERQIVDAVLGAPSDDWHGGEAARARRHLLLPTLHAVAARVGWISEGALNYVARRLTVPPADAYGVASFYALFALSERAPRVVHVCDDIACKARGADAIIAALERDYGIAGSTPDDGATTWLRSPCLGLCERAPAAYLSVAGERPYARQLGGVDVRSIGEALRGGGERVFPSTILPQAGDPGLRLLRRVGVVDPSSIQAYGAAGGYQALRRALEIGASGVIREVSDARLMGRGGAAFPTGRKWDAVAKEPERPHYLVCNADESEPGTFKDRILMEEDPFAVVEAMTITAFATGADYGYLYVRGEYPLATERMQHALDEARRHNFLGCDILGTEFDFDVEIRRGAGAYICGEETSLFNSIEGHRGEPRNKPPFPVQKGLFGKPTAINNVETLVNLPDIVMDGGAAYAAIGTKDSTGTKLFCVSGCIAKPGLYEVPFGTTLRQLLALAGGVLPERRLQAVLLGGAAGAFATPEELDTPLTFEGVRKIRATLGSGVVLVFDDRINLGEMLLRIAAFFRDESCGQCVPCRIGTVRQEELLARLKRREPLHSLQDERTLLAEVGAVMRDASICGLGQTASSAIESALAKFRPFEGAVRA
ncbi:MAG: NAD(P)H-dependent oxidoreductase subunit E [Candidatus Eremiobacteraeota bacterium]|nr:NAD(P)H-dependent oxidoreductase subunit E [Candidatus Eremiobacteraeota bacterium]MBV9646956.1 NAD(P)H-dependent oxidoreductase subunit E [Candidatus Eremiobacteraeota bacterium]